MQKAENAPISDNPFEAAFNQPPQKESKPDNATNDAMLDISDSAIERIIYLRQLEGDDNLMLRIKVSGGGCSGYQYIFSFENQLTPDDIHFEKKGVRVVSDKISLEFLNGCTIDFVDELIGSSFQVINPNASASCGCGTSFAV